MTEKSTACVVCTDYSKSKCADCEIPFCSATCISGHYTICAKRRAKKPVTFTLVSLEPATTKRFITYSTTRDALTEGGALPEDSEALQLNKYKYINALRATTYGKCKWKSLGVLAGYMWIWNGKETEEETQDILFAKSLLVQLDELEEANFDADFVIKRLKEIFNSENVERAALEYKFHLQSYDEYTASVMKRLFQPASCPMWQYASKMKFIVNNANTELEEDPRAAMVIYPNRRKEDALLLFAELHRLFPDSEDYSGKVIERTPRFNRRINAMLYYANSSGDYKEVYRAVRKKYGITEKELPNVFNTDYSAFKGHELFVQSE